MEQDIVPDLLDAITKNFDAKTLASPKIKQALKLLKAKEATYLTVNDFAVEAGEILAKVFGEKITAEILPDGKMYFNIADRLLNTTLSNNFDLISGFAGDVQKELNEAAEIGLKVQTPELNQDKIDGLVNRISSETNFEDISWILNEPIVNFCQSIVDDSIQKNAEFQASTGLHPTIERTMTGHGCKWCRNLARNYDYPNVPKDVFRRHERCRCIVDYNPKTGKKKNVWTKNERIVSSDKLEARKQMNQEVKANNRKADSKDYKKYVDVLGQENMSISLAKFQEMKYNDVKKWETFMDYAHSRETHAISAFSTFDDYVKYKKDIEDNVVGLVTSDGVKIKSQSKHFIERVLGTTLDPKTGNPRSGVSIEGIRDALINGTATQSKSDKSVTEYHGKKARVTVNSLTGNLVQTNLLSSKRKVGKRR